MDELFFLVVALRAANDLSLKLAESRKSADSSESVRSSRTLQKRSDFLLLKDKGIKSSPRRWVTFFSHENSTGSLRVGFTLSRKVGPSVLRNRLRRRGREFFRLALKEGLQIGVDINVVFRPMEPNFYKNLEHDELREAFKKGLKMVQQRHPVSGPSHD